MRTDNALLGVALDGVTFASDAESRAFWSKPVAADELARTFIQYSRDIPVDPGVVFYETMSGARMGDNPFAIFSYLRSHAAYGNFLHVWSIDSQGSVPDEYSELDDVVFVRRNSASYAYFLARAEHVICNANLPGYYVRRDGQRYLNTWHGTPYKALGRDTPQGRFGAPTSTGSFIKPTHVLSTCPFTTEAFLSAYSMTGTSTAVIAETGYPRVDLTVNATPAQKAALRERIGISSNTADTHRPVVLYAPTWRAESGEDVVDTDQLLSDLRALAELDVQFLYRGHHRMNRIIRDAFVGDTVGQVIIPDHDISSNELLSVVDILITDYSSIFFDFLPTGRPIINYLYDLDEYKSARGLNLDVDDLPGTVARTEAELMAAVESAVSILASKPSDHDFRVEPAQGARYVAAQQRFCPHEDGESAGRAARFLFRDLTAGVPTRLPRGVEPTVVYWAGTPMDPKDGSAFLEEAARSGKSPRSQTTLVIDRFAVVDKSAVQRFRKVKARMSTISFNDKPPVLLSEERSAYDAFVGQEGITFERVQQLLLESPVLKGIFLREYRRRLDDAQFDEVVLRTGLSNHEMAVAAFAGSVFVFAGTRPSFEVEPPPPALPPKPATVQTVKPRTVESVLRKYTPRKVKSALRKLLRRSL